MQAVGSFAGARLGLDRSEGGGHFEKRVNIPISIILYLYFIQALSSPSVLFFLKSDVSVRPYTARFFP